jgi:hypothetical protein
LRRAARAKQFDVPHRVGVQPAQIQICQATLQLVADEQVDDRVAVIHAADGAVLVDFDVQSSSAEQGCGW